MTSSAPPNPRRPRPLFAATLIAAPSIGVCASTLYVPSLPAMARALETSVGAVQATMTVYLLTYVVCQLAAGPLSDRLGRRRILFAGLALFVAASLACAAATEIWMLMAARVVQAAGACAGLVVARSIVRDVFDAKEISSMLAMLAAAVALAGLSAPVLGGYLQAAFDWRFNFIVLAGFGVATLVAAVASVEETHRPEALPGSLVAAMLGGMGELLRLPRFWFLSLVIAGCAVGIYTTLAALPVILIDRAGLPADTAGYFIATQICGFMVGNILGTRINRRFSADALIRVSLVCLALNGVFMLTVAADGGGPLTLIAPLALMGFFYAFVGINTVAASVNLHPRLIGTAAGLSGFSQMLGAAAGTAIAAALGVDTLAPVGMIFIVVAAMGLVLGAAAARR